VLDLYFADLKRLVAEVLDDPNRRPRERLRRYLDLITDRLVEAEFSRGCLIGDFSLEAAPQSEMLRTRLGEIVAEWRAPFAACIAEGRAAGEIAETFAPHDLAEFLLSSWEGAILRMKVEAYEFKEIGESLVSLNAKGVRRCHVEASRVGLPLIFVRKKRGGRVCVSMIAPILLAFIWLGLVLLGFAWTVWPSFVACL
jgi:AcrR family transcriptional regulator